jgi:hypothetical protein
MEKPSLKMFKITKKECEGIVTHFNTPTLCPVDNYFPYTSKFKYPSCNFCKTLFVGYDLILTLKCPCDLYGKSFGTDALITLLEYNDYEIPGDPEDYVAIREFI